MSRKRRTKVWEPEWSEWSEPREVHDPVDGRTYIVRERRVLNLDAHRIANWTYVDPLNVQPFYGEGGELVAVRERVE